MYVAGPADCVTADVEDPNYDGVFLNRDEMKTIASKFYQKKSKWEKGRRPDDMRPHLFRVGWEHPSKDSYANVIGEFRDMYIDGDGRMMTIMRIHPGHEKSMEIINRLNAIGSGEVMDLEDVPMPGISLDTQYVRRTEGSTSRITSKSITGISLVQRPALSKLGTYVSAWAPTEAELYEKLFGDGTQPVSPPIYMSKDLRERIAQGSPRNRGT